MQFQKRWMQFAGLGLVLFGLLGFLGTMPETREPLRWALDLLAWPLDGFPTLEARDAWFLSALAGGFLAGWGVTVFCLASWLWDVAPEKVRMTYLTGLSGWFIVDSTGSITSGNWPNALWNIAVILCLIGPLWRPAIRLNQSPYKE